MESLSGDLMAYLAGFLGVQDVVRLGAVSRRMRARVAGNEALWLGLACRLLGSEAPKTRQVPVPRALFFFSLFSFSLLSSPLSSHPALCGRLWPRRVWGWPSRRSRGASFSRSALLPVFLSFFLSSSSSLMPSPPLPGHLFVDGADVGCRGRAPRPRRGRGSGRADAAALADGPGDR